MRLSLQQTRTRAKIVDKIRLIHRQAEEIYVITNNHFCGKAVCNALEIKVMIEEKKVRIPEAILRCYVQIEEIQEEELCIES